MNSSSRRYLTVGISITVVAILAIGSGMFARATPTRRQDVSTPPAAVRTSVVAPRTSDNVRVAAAKLLGSRYAQSRLIDWKARVNAAGPDCEVLLIEVAVILDAAKAEGMNYGIGSYVVYDGGVQRYYVERGFRGVVYRDSSGKDWPFGSVSDAEAASLIPCE